MYGGGYPQAKFSLDAKKMQRPKGKSCGYYWRVIFFFSSLIQSLIIVSLVLFMVYGRREKSSEAERMAELQKSFDTSTVENRVLREEKHNLTLLLNVTLTKKLVGEQDLRKLRLLANISRITIINCTTKLTQYEMEEKRKLLTRLFPVPCTSNTGLFPNPSGDSRFHQLDMMRRLLQANFTQTVQHLTRELDAASRARDALRLDVIGLRRNATDLQRRLDAYGRKCKEDFALSLGGIQTVTRAFIERIDRLFPSVLPFQLTCLKQRDQLEQIRSNCSSLSREVEAKFQSYLDSVGTQMSQIQGRSSQLQVQGARLQEDLEWCRRNRTAEAAEAGRRSLEAQRRNDAEVERLLREQKRLREERELRQYSAALKDGEAAALRGQVQRLNASLANCIPRKPTTGTGLPKPGLTGIFPGMAGAGLNFPGMAGPGISGDLQKHLKELQDMANKESGVSG